MLAFRVVFFKYGQAGLSDSQIKKMAKNCGLKVVDSKSYGVVPQNEVHSILPWKLTSAIDSLFTKVFPRLLIGYNVVYILKHENS